VDNFRALNFANDAELDRRLTEGQAALPQHHAETYRDDASARLRMTEGIRNLANAARSWPRPTPKPWSKASAGWAPEGSRWPRESHNLQRPAKAAPAPVKEDPPPDRARGFFILERTTMKRVTWTNELDEDTDRAAATVALAIMRDHESTATVFDITDEAGKTVRVDLRKAGGLTPLPGATAAADVLPAPGS
jgi:hypothetical protein